MTRGSRPVGFKGLSSLASDLTEDGFDRKRVEGISSGKARESENEGETEETGGGKYSADVDSGADLEWSKAGNTTGDKKERARISDFSPIVVIGVIFIVALVSGIWVDMESSSVTRGSVEATRDRTVTSNGEATYRIVAPRIGLRDRLSLEELRWCAIEHVRIDVLHGFQEGQRQLRQLQAMRDDWSGRCAGRSYSEAVLDRVGDEVERMGDWIEEDTYRRKENLLRTPELPSGEGTAGGRSDVIREIQSLLSQAGYDPGPIDGQYGPITRRAIEKYEMDLGILVTGQATDEVLLRLRVTVKRDSTRY